jgi:hypothetical protein
MYQYTLGVAGLAAAAYYFYFAYKQILGGCTSKSPRGLPRHLLESCTERSSQTKPGFFKIDGWTCTQRTA